MVPVVLLEAEEFWVREASFDVESHRNVIERVFVQRFIVVTHVNEQRLFIAQVVIILQFII